ncbi:uracil-xanthine permease [Austwickia chelonae]|uniref:Putative uracil permease n=1 Tax=Austwickia chelonae NBRC 105200 TaxID=1184607 RepID=K6V8S3_9MICO|nr:solute carrier family 23 protein [Austwickia chelonae]GAB78618.1 putative uracil permease [Austwickia chelonae NBRC 105200]SEW34168.1 uracil-xanthine permease [Austwickia chelonae]
MALGWTLHGDGRTIGPDDIVGPGERLTWGRTVGLGMQHVVAMFGATFVFPVVMGLNPQLAIMMSGFATLCFLVALKGRVPSYLGSSASFVGGAVAVHQLGGTPQQVSGAVLVAGVVLALIGLFIHVAGASALTRVLPPVVTGAVVMLIGFNLAPVVAKVYWPQDQGVAFVVMVAVIAMSVGLRGFLGRVSIALALLFGYLLSAVLDRVVGPVTAFNPVSKVVDTHPRVDWSAVADAPWWGFPPATDAAAGVVGWHLPQFSLTYVLIVLPAVIALVAENVGHVKAVAEMTGQDLDDVMGKAIATDGLTSVVATAVGGAPTTTYAENIGVMAATRIYSTAAYLVAALTAIAFGFSPKFGAIVSATPGGVLGGITVVLYGMIGLLGAKIWKENHVDFSTPLNLVPVAAGIIIAIGDVNLSVGPVDLGGLHLGQFTLTGIALGTLVTVGSYHLARAVAPADMIARADGAGMIVTRPGLDEVEELEKVRGHRQPATPHPRSGD